MRISNKSLNPSEDSKNHYEWYDKDLLMENRIFPFRDVSPHLYLSHVSISFISVSLIQCVLLNLRSKTLLVITASLCIYSFLNSYFFDESPALPPFFHIRFTCFGGGLLNSSPGMTLCNMKDHLLSTLNHWQNCPSATLELLYTTSDCAQLGFNQD